MDCLLVVDHPLGLTARPSRLNAVKHFSASLARPAFSIGRILPTNRGFAGLPPSFLLTPLRPTLMTRVRPRVILVGQASSLLGEPPPELRSNPPHAHSSTAAAIDFTGSGVKEVVVPVAPIVARGSGSP